MAITRIGLNISNLKDITAPTFDIKNSTEAFLNDIPVKANQITEGYFGVITLSALFTFLYWKLSQENFFGGDFGLSKTRAVGIAAAISSIIGLINLNIGYFTVYYHIVIFIVVTMLSTAAVWKAEK